ncbi:alpha-glucuronidase [Anaerocolumna jejuensis]|uniref:alpha-glucuronidase n=1 Tax=Anaerocolumna jejuensis TaxID=259063 RepID=UPI003F7C50B2
MKYSMAWLSYRRLPFCEGKEYFRKIYVQEENEITGSAVYELCRGAKELLGIKTVVIKLPETFDQDKREKTEEGIYLLPDSKGPVGGGYRIVEENGRIRITAAEPEGLLYGSFDLIRQVQRGVSLRGINRLKLPDNPLRMLNHWDNMDGSIERGYSGNSFFFRNDRVLVEERTEDYARLTASVGINGVVINNVNVTEKATRLITGEYADSLKRMGEIFSKYGIRLYLSLNFAAPMELGGLETADPEAEEVRAWWQEQMKETFRNIPSLGGFLVKADSEGRPGPLTYGRTQAQGANMLAEAVRPYGGIIIWRCFVYNCTQDWRDRKTDRARSAYDYFMPLDGKFEENVILQIKNGPMDFQVREPVSSLFGSLKNTNQMLEVQIAQEYTGQQRHVCYLIPQFKEILGFHTHCREEEDTVADIVSGRSFSHKNCGMAAVANTGSDSNWTGHDLAAANWFGFGRLAFDTSLSAEEIAREWCECTFGTDKAVVYAICKILLMSWPAYEKYTSPLGIGWMLSPNNHYGPNVDGYEYDRWGTYHRADHLGIGVERGKTGTGFTQTYLEPNASLYEEIETCPEELLLFFHYMPYTYRLKSGKTLIQHIYDSHFEGVEDVEKMVNLWEGLKGKIPDEVFKRVKLRMDHQLDNSAEWRDQINSYFYRKSFIMDEKGRKIY